jgi:hypothetical protein
VFAAAVTCHHIEHCCVSAARNGEIFRFHAMKTKSDVIIQDTESQVVTNISECFPVAMYSEPEVQIFPK